MRTLITAVALLVALATSAPAACFVGASVGAAASTSRLDDGTARIDLGAQAPMIGPEVGCAFAVEGLKITPGFLARYDITNLRATVDTNSLRSPGRWMVAPTIGFQLNPNAGIYGLLGVTGAKLEIPDLASASTFGLVLGGGVNLDIGQKGWSAFAEYNHIRSRGKDLGGVSALTSENVARLGLRYRFGQ